MALASGSCATSESYCNHLRGQVTEWQRAFKSKNGRVAVQKDLQALEHDVSARGRLVYGAYVALNRSTGGAFAESLAKSASSRNVTVIGGPRQSAAERLLSSNLSNPILDANLGKRGQVPSARNGEDSKRAGSTSGGGGAQQTELSEHLAVMNSLRPKVQPRSMLGAKSSNAVLAARDGHHRKGDDDEAVRSKDRREGKAGSAGVSVSKRARAMGAKAELERASRSAKPASAVGSRSRGAGAETTRIVCAGGAAGGRHGVHANARGVGEGSLKQEEPRRSTENLVHEEAAASTKRSQNENGCGLADVYGGHDAAENGEHGDGEGEKERERVAPRKSRNNINISRAGNARRRDRSSAQGMPSSRPDEPSSLTYGSRNSLKQTSSLRASLSGLTPGSNRTSSTGVRGRISAATSPCANPHVSIHTASSSKARPAVGSRPARSGVGSGGIAGVDALKTGADGLDKLESLPSEVPNEAGLAVAMASIISGDSARFSATANGGQYPPTAVTVPRIVNTVGGGGGGLTSGHCSSGRVQTDLAPSQPSNRVSSSAGSKGKYTSVESLPKGTRSESSSLTGGVAEVICGPGLVASSSGHSRGMKPGADDWQLRASRAVERVLEEKQRTAAMAESGRQSNGDDGSFNDEPETIDPVVREQQEERRSNREAVKTSGLVCNRDSAAAVTVARSRVSDSEDDGDDERNVDTFDDKNDVEGDDGGSRHLPHCASSRGRRGMARKSVDVGGLEAGRTDSGPARDTLASDASSRESCSAGVSKTGRRKPAKKTEVSDNFVRMDLKSRGSSRFKRKNSLRDKARGGAGGRGAGRFGGGGRGSYGHGRFGSKWNKTEYNKRKGFQDPVTGEQSGARDRPLSSGAAKNRAGLDVLDQCLDALAIATGDSEESKKSAVVRRPRNAREEEELFLRLAPRCAQHQRAGKLLTVRKSGLNKGRKFYACSLPRGEGCDFFMWAEDNPALVLSELRLEETKEEWTDRKAALWKNTFQKLPIPELKKELKKRSLGCGGKKDELVQRLVNHATSELGAAATTTPVSIQVVKQQVLDTRRGTVVGSEQKSDGRGMSSRRGGDSSSSGDSASGSDEASSAEDVDDFEFAFGDEKPECLVSSPGSSSCRASGVVTSTDGVLVDADDRDCDTLKFVGSAGDMSPRLRAGEKRTHFPPQPEVGRMNEDALENNDSRLDGMTNSHDQSACTNPSSAAPSGLLESRVYEADKALSEDDAVSPSKKIARTDSTGSSTKSRRLGKVVSNCNTPLSRRGSKPGPHRGIGVGMGASMPDDDSSVKESGECGGLSGSQEGDYEQPAWGSLVDSDSGEEGNDSSSDDDEDVSDDGRDSDEDDDETSDGEEMLVDHTTNKRKKRATAAAVKISRKRPGGPGRGATDGDQGSDIGCPDEDDGRPLTPASALRRVFGHREFRDGQEWGIKRALAGLPSLLVLATGTGKSLTYQLSALLLPGITVVVSPLVSLMEDQMANLPPQLPGASLSGSHGGLREVARTVRDLRAGRIKVLFLSPEKLCSPAFRRLASIQGALPPVSLLCVDEAHCVSQWSHNFRPSYLRLGQAIELVRPKGVLALTATASKAVAQDICKVLRIPTDGVRVGSWDRPNLEVKVLRTVSDDDKRETLSRLLLEPPLEKGSVVVYVWRQATAEALSSLLQGDGHHAVAYHGGMEAGARQNAQNSFTRGKARIVVATVAFGLGVDMRDIRGVIHFDMPKSIENYVQEIGRAGRDGRTANCCLLLCDRDFVVHHSLAHSKGLELVQVRGLMRAIAGDVRSEPDRSVEPDLSVERASEASTDVHGNEGNVDVAKDGDIVGGNAAHNDQGTVAVQKALSVVDLESKLDVGGAVVETVLSMLEGEPYRLLKLHAVMDDRLHVHFRKRRPAVLAQGEPVIGLLLALGTVEGLPAGPSGYSYGHGSAKVSLVQLSEALGWASTAVVRELRRLQLAGEVDYSLSQRSYHITLLKGLSASGLEALCVDLYRALARAEVSEVHKVEAIYRALAAEAVNNKHTGAGRSSHIASAQKTSSKSQETPVDDGAREAAGLLHSTISRYFDQGPSATTRCGDDGCVKSAANNDVKSTADGAMDDTDGAAAIVNDFRRSAASACPPKKDDGNTDMDEVIFNDDVTPSRPTKRAGKPKASKYESEQAFKPAQLRLPHQALDKRACELLVRDASVLVTDPSFRGRLDAGFDDNDGGGGVGGGGGLGYFDIATGRTGALGGVEGGRRSSGMALHSWLLKDVPMLARAVARVFHGIGSISFPAMRWRESAFWARYREYSFGEVKSKLELAFNARQ